MTGPAAPRLDPRRKDDFAAELQRRARAWIPSWDLANADGDFGRALLDIAARFSAEVSERLDNAGEKMRRGFLDWLAVRSVAARPARVPVVFKLTDAARTAVLAEAPVRLQAPAGDTTVVFETEKDVRIVPGRLVAIAGVDGDAYYLAPPGLSNLDPVDSTPTRWLPKRFTAAGSSMLQLDPEGGLVVDDFIEAGGLEYRVTKVDKDIVTIEPPLDADLSADEVVSKVDSFAPFDPATRNWQKHELYLGDTDLLNIEAAATIEVVGATALQDGFAWEYYGKVAPREEAGWQPLTVGTPTEQSAAKGLVLHKKKGSVDPYVVNGTSSRWIRARVAASSEMFTADQLSLRINAAQCADKPCSTDPDTPSVTAEGMANNTPLVLETTFFPLGKQPRQFDAFYLGSKEAFSKPGARAHLCFQMSDPRFTALAALRGGSSAATWVAGVAADGYLHMLWFDGAGHLSRYGNPRRPPSPDANGSLVAGAPVALDPTPAFPPAFWADGILLKIAVSSKQTVWLWEENLFLATHSGWRSLGVIDAAAPTTATVRGLVHLADAARGSLFALLDKALYVLDLNVANGQWKRVETKQGTTAVSLQRIAPVASQAGGMNGTTTEGLIGVAVDGKVFAVSTAGACTKLLNGADPDIAPAAVRRSIDNCLIAVAVGKSPAPRDLLGYLSKPGALTQDDTDDDTFDWPNIAGKSIDADIIGGQVTFAFGVKDGDEQALETWAPFATSAAAPLFEVSVPSPIGVFGGAPTLWSGYVLVPTEGSEVIVASYDPSRRTTFIAPEGAAVVTETAADRLLPGDSVAYHVPATTPLKYKLEAIPDAGIAVGNRRYHGFSTPADKDEVLVYKATPTPFKGSIDTPGDLTLLTIDGADSATKNGSARVLLVTAGPTPALYLVTGLDPTKKVATLDRALVLIDATAKVTYQTPDASSAAVLPTLELNATSNTWDQSLLARTRIYFEGGKPAMQSGIVLPPDAAPPPQRVVLGAFWTTAPAPLPQGLKFTIDAALGDWTRQLGDTSTNPELSWEYWNGTGWWTLGSVKDDTRNLKNSGGVSFTVPVDLEPVDWSGKTNHWIRARLIGGDYGQEKITVVTTTNGNKSEQTVQRSTDGIRAPVVLHLHISYGLCKPIVPGFVYAADSGSFRDQSDANRTPGAIVEALVPLPVLLGGLSAPAPLTAAQQDGCPPECGCGGQTAPASPAPASKTGTSPAADTDACTASSGSTTGASDRQILIGVAAALSEAPVNILLLVEERKHAALAPMVVEALNGDRFKPLVVDDATRALGESGVLSLSFAIPPVPRELFGRTLRWLRLTPKRGASGTWAPVIRGAYLNAVFASATETLTRELLGSSDGAPNLTMRVARPPVLHDTLELRVREPLGDEERTQLRATDESVVLSDDPNLTGDWVRWTRVIDPADEAPGQRVYALDEAIGEVRFGDGLHGMIPPIGTDSIVAFSYKRTEPPAPGSEDVPANAVAVRTPLNVVSPVESVESVIAADQAAGGAPTESDERVLRFGFARLRHRGRAVTASDLEDIALQSSPDIVQARCVTTRTGLRLTVVMKGAKPSPTAAQVRELRRLLLDAAPPSMSAPGALSIVGPKVRELRLDLTLRIERLDSAGDVARAVKAKLAAFFDTATGGMHESGWPLGANPSDEDIALALLDVPLLESIGGVTPFEHVDGEADRPWPAALKAGELAVLAADPVRIQFETAEVPA